MSTTALARVESHAFRKIGFGSTTDPLAIEQAQLSDTTTGAAYFQAQGNAAADDQTAIGYYQSAAGIASNAAQSASAKDSANLGVKGLAAVASGLFNTTQSAGSRSTAQAACAQAIQTAQQAINMARQDLSPLPAPAPSPTPTPTPAPTTTTVTPTWVPWAVGGVLAAGSATALYFAWPHARRHAKRLVRRVRGR